MKRFLYILAVILISLLLVLGALVGALLSSDVQTAIVRVATEEISRGLGAEAQIGKVDYSFPARLRLNDIYIEDQLGDTLLYAQEAYVHLRLLPLREQRLELRKVRLQHVKAYGRTLPDGEPNFGFLLKAFASQDTTSKPLPDLIVGAKDLVLENIVARYDDWEGELTRLELSLNTLSKREIDLQLKHLNGQIRHEGNTVDIEDIRIDGLWNDTILTFPTFYAKLPNSLLDLSGVKLQYPNIDWETMDLKQIPVDSILFFMHVNDAILSPCDIGLFVPAIGTIDHAIRLQADLAGTLDSLHMSTLALNYGDYTLLQGNVMLEGLPEIRQTTFKAEVEDIHINSAILQDLLSDIQNKPVRLPAEVRRLGEMHYRGALSGRVDSLTLKGAFRTAIGTITTDGRLQIDSSFNDLTFNGRVATNRFRLGRLLNNSDFSTVSLAIHGYTHYNTAGHIDGNIHAKIREFCFRNYCYRDIRLEGQFNDLTYQGLVAIDDENVQLSLNGLLDYQGNDSELDIDMALRRLHMQPLNLSQKYSDADLRLKLSIHTIGWQLDSLVGYLRIDSLMFRNGDDSIPLNELEIILQNEPPKKLLKMTSDYAALCIKGQYDYATLLTTLQKAGIRYIPELFSDEIKREVRARYSHNDIDFYLYGRQIRKLQRVLDIPFFISDYPVLKGYLNERENMFGLQGYVPYIRMRKGDIRDITLSVHNTEERAFATLSAGWYDSNYTLQTTIKDNLLHIDFAAADKQDSLSSHIQADALFSRYRNQPVIDLHCLPGVINIADSTIFIADSHIRFVAVDTELHVDSFRIGTAAQFIAANGVASPRMTDSLHVQLSHINAGAIMPFVVAEETIVVGGDLSGWAQIYGLFSQPMFNADVTLDSAFLNEACIGDAKARLYLDKETNHLIIDGDVVQRNHRVAHVDGLVEPEKNSWGLDIYPDSFSLAFINHWTQGIIDDIDGRAWGKVKVMGEGPKTWVLTQAYVENGALTIPYTGCRYHFSDSAFMDSTAIHFADMNLYDEEGNELYLNGHLYHTYFKNFSFEINASPKHCLAINLPDKPGEFLQGKVYADGEVRIAGNDEDVKLTAKAQAVGKSRFRLSVDGASTASDADFISFVDHNVVEIEEDENEFKKKEEDQSFLTRKYLSHLGPKTRFQIMMDIDITPELLFQLMLNDRTGDMLQGRGDGSLRFTYDDSTGDVRLMGTYTLLSGSLGFTIGNLVRRDFTLAEGSRVIWNGRAEVPELDVTAKYKVVASLRDLFGDEVNALTTSRTSVPVNCCVTITGSIEDPTIRFALELPNSEDVIQTQVRSIINTDEMLMRQVVYLLVFGKFFTPEYLKNSNYSGLNETYSLLSSTITGQINSWLGKLTNVFTMGFNFRSEGVGSEATQEYEAQFQLQPIDRLVINGNVGYRYNDITNRPVFGDVDVEYMITPNGKLRLKAYTHTVDKYSLRQADTQQGVGFIFKHDFNWKKDRSTP